MAKPKTKAKRKSNPNMQWWIAGAVLFISTILLFARLGHYAVWDDEAMITLSAEGVLKTGDTSLMHGSNIVAYRGGILANNLRDRSTPPLSAYLTAPFIALFGANALAARLAFALCGLGCVALILWWALKSGASAKMMLILAMALLGNVSLFLFLRQCRYYAPTALLTIAVAFLYTRWKESRRELLAMGLLTALLFAANYMACIALYVCITVDYLIWGRKEMRLGVADWVAWVVPEAIGCAAIASIWNPKRTEFGSYAAHNSVADRLTLFWWNWRDMNACEFMVLALLLASVVAGFVMNDRWVKRGSVALVFYGAFVTLISPQTMSNTNVADVRYLMAVIPLCIAIEVLGIGLLTRAAPWLAVPLGVLAFGTNVFNGGPLLDRGFHSTIKDFVGELIDPPGDPYAVTADWINRNVPKDSSVWVLPDYATYPLMFHAPNVTYAWQLPEPPPAQFAGLPAIHYQGRIAPDYLIAFGPFVQELARMLQHWNKPGVSYQQVATIDYFWKDVHRPELFWRSFTPIKGYDPRTQGIYVFKRTTP